MQINCLHPVTIVNPLAAELIAEYGNYTIFGNTYDIPRFKLKRLLYDFKFPFIYQEKKKVTGENIDSCFVTDRTTGECYPLYIQVPCNHCEICECSKINAMVHRCKLETLSYNCFPLFLTLTYNEKNRPKNGVTPRDVQLFFKRLRINLYRKGYRERIRYFLVSEYGNDERFSRRPHYHCILWNLHQTDFLSYREILQELQKAWNNGFIQSRFIDSTDDKAFQYTAKYIFKSNDVPEGQNKNFVLSSNRGGGIASRFIDRFKSKIRREFIKQPKFCNQFTLRTEDLYLNRYILNRLFPSFCCSLPLKLKSDVRDYLKSYSVLKNYYNLDVISYEHKAIEISKFFSSFFFCPILESSEINFSMVDSPTRCLRTLTFLESKIERAMRRGFPFFKSALENGRLRNLYLSRLFEFELPVRDLESRADLFRKYKSLAKQREVL